MEAILYTEDGSDACRQVRDFLDRHGVTYEERNVSRDLAYRDELAWSGLGRVPVVVVFGTAVEGFRPDALRELLGLEGE